MNGQNIVASTYIEVNERSLKAVNPATGLTLDGDFFKASERLVDDALTSATLAFQSYRNLNKDLKAAFLNAIADEIANLGEELVNRASAESEIGRAHV